MPDRVVFLGPDVWAREKPSPWFEECEVEGYSEWARNAELPYGIKVRVGRWLVPGRPIAMLVHFQDLQPHVSEFYGEMWERYTVDSLHAYGDYDEGCAFGIASGMVIEDLVKNSIPEAACPQRIIAHFDEWTTGMGLLYVKSRVGRDAKVRLTSANPASSAMHLPLSFPTVATVFTTHATSIGRSICGNGKPLYDFMKGYHGDQMARELNMEAKHSLEKAAAHAAEAFTTVSEITARECEQLLERRPDVVTMNGFEADFVPSGAEFDAKRASARRVLLDIAGKMRHTQYPDDTFIVVTGGRCEYRNKGLDMLLDAVKAETEGRKKEAAGDDENRATLTFVLVPAWAAGPVRGLTNPVLTHELHNPGQDPIYNRLLHLGFADGKDGVIYVPCYLNGDDGVFNKTYYDLLIGADATVFPSYYEPWGYTPLESVAFGVPTVTTSLSGFGQWILSTTDNTFDGCGVRVVQRTDSNYHQAVDEIADALTALRASRGDAFASAAQATAAQASWQNFIKDYLKAYNIAINKIEN